MTKKSVLVSGATGYIGSNLVAHLRIQGHNVYALTGAHSNPHDIAFLKATEASIVSNHKLVEGINYLPRDVDVVVHLIGSVEPKYGESSQKLHLEPTEDIIRNCFKNDIKNIILISSLNASLKGSSQYSRSKWQQEELIKNSGLNFLILRPSLVIGRAKGIRDSKLVMKYLNYIKSLPVIPVINNAQNLVQPIYIEDLVNAIELAIDSLTGNLKLDKSILELGGGQVLSFKDLVIKLMNLQNCRKPFFNLDKGKALMFISILNQLSLNSNNIYDQIQLATENNICQVNDLVDTLKLTPQDLDFAVQTYRM